LDQPLTTWNRAGAAIPLAPQVSEPLEQVAKRCVIAVPATPAARALAAAGWLPLQHLDRELVNGDVEILAGMTAADGMCRPLAFNLFVFAGGRYAGTLSPVVMSSRADGSAGAVRFVNDTIAAEFARYKAGVALCCPAARVSVTFRVERAAAGATVAPVEMRTTRSY
jgi:hypothetical protein